MDIHCTAHRNSPFVDDKCYPKLCFGCYWTPKTEDQIYTRTGEVEELRQLEFSHRNLMTAEELFNQGTCETLRDARRCIRAVKNACKEAGLDGRKKGKSKKRPKDPQMELPKSFPAL